MKTEAQMKRSYNAYLKWRAYWKNKGYKLDEQMSPDEYTEFHVAQMLMGGDPNIARTIAHNELAYTATGAKRVAKQMKKNARIIQESEEKFNDVYDDIHLRDHVKNLRAKEIIEYYSDWKKIISAPDREQVFLDLASANIDVDLWDLDETERTNLYGKDLARFREQFEADLYGSKK